MRHNRIGIVLAVLLSAVALSGCLNVKDLDEKQSDLIAEYSAGVLLRYSDTYERRLITREQAAEDGDGTQAGTADSKTATPSPSPVSTAPPGQTAAAEETPGPEETAQEVSLDELYGIDGLPDTQCLRCGQKGKSHEKRHNIPVGDRWRRVSAVTQYA